MGMMIEGKSHQLVHSICGHRMHVAEYTKHKNNSTTTVNWDSHIERVCNVLQSHGISRSSRWLFGDEYHKENKQACGHTVGCHHNSNPVGVAAGKFQQSKEMTTWSRQWFRTTEGQADHEKNLHSGRTGSPQSRIPPLGAGRANVALWSCSTEVYRWQHSGHRPWW